jgi:hypothetical protein
MHSISCRLQYSFWLLHKIIILKSIYVSSKWIIRT